jgi:predicted Zn-dependent protease
MAQGRKEAEKLISQILGIARKLAPTAEVGVSLRSGRSANTRFAKNEITSSGDVDETSVAVEVALGLRHAETTTNQTDPASLSKVVESAVRLAKLAPEDPEYMPVLAPQRYEKVASGYDPATASMGAVERAHAAATAIATAEELKLEAAGYYEHTAEAQALGTSAGLFAYHMSTNAEFTTTARTGDATGSGWAGGVGHRAGDVDATQLVRVAADKALRSQKPRRLEPGRYTVILEPAAVGELMDFLVWALDARQADEGRSFFSRPGGGQRVGERLFGDAITLKADPADPLLPSAPFDRAGLPRKARRFIDRGSVAELLYSRYWAKKQGKEPTARPDLYHLAGGTAVAADLLSNVKKGVLITRFWYTRWVDPQSMLITGLTRDGVFLVENGQISGPVNNFRFNESPITMLKNADAMTTQTVRVPTSRVRTPALRTHGFHLASISEAI